MQFVPSNTKDIQGCYKGKKVLLTGGSGFIGSHLVKALLRAGADVTVVVRYLSEMRNVRLSGFWKSLNILEADIRNQDSLTQLHDLSFDVIFHLGAYNHVGQSFLNVSEVMDVNAKGTANFIDACRNYGRFVYTSTSEVYGLQESVPFVETMEPHPISPYAISKYAGELYCRMKYHIGNNPIVIIRPFNVFGPYQSTKAIIPELIIKCLRGEPVETTEGKQTREFNFVENIIEGFLRCGMVEGLEGQVINVAEGHEIAVRDLAASIHRLSNSKSDLRIGALPYRPTEIWRMYADATKAKQLLGWEVRVPFQVGLQRTIEWYKEYLAEFDDKSSSLNSL